MGKGKSKGKRPAWGVSTWLADGIAAHKRGDVDAAERHYQRILFQEPTHADALHLSGLVARARGDMARAAALIRRAIAASPDFALYHMNLGLVLADAGEPDAAARELERALEIDPSSSAAAFNLGIAHEQRGDLERAAEAYGRASEGDAALPEASFNLGNVLAGLKRHDAAVDAYRRAIELRPEYPRAIANLASALQQLERLEEAAQAYRDLLQVDPKDVEARHMLAALTGEARERSDPAYVVKFFDDYAPRFEKVLVEDLEYKVPEAIAELLEPHRPAVRFARALDLGCGTGLLGRALRDRCEVLVGVDLSPNMLAKAREAGGYDELVASDLADFLRARGDERFDLFVAADVFIYVGDMREPFTLVASRATPGALFAFSVESAEGDGFFLEKTGRFSHGHAYVEATAIASGFTVLDARDVVVRMERGVPIRGRIFLLKTAAAGA